jgi:hypothetical protein
VSMISVSSEINALRATPKTRKDDERGSASQRSYRRWG